MDSTFYVTTPIYYVNGTPHIGHAYTTTAADVSARWSRLKGQPTYFLTGTDEHGQKVFEAAQARGLSPQAHCDELAGRWKQMMSEMDISYDRFMRTTDADHVALVQSTLADLQAKGLLYRAEYTGWYSVADEIFVTEKDISEGRYDRAKLQEITEANWFFKMGAYQQQLIDHIAHNPGFIRPESRKNEVLGFLRKELTDLCISRPVSRLPWGIPLPFDSEFVTYVWFDALLNYLTATGYAVGDAAQGAPIWPPTMQFLGKDILTTHAVYWSTMLLGMGLPLPKSLVAHGWWVAADGEKMSKSKGNALDIDLLLAGFGSDAVRYFFLREVAFGLDGTFSWDGLVTRLNADLSNDLGNLAHRALSMSDKWLGARVPEAHPSERDAALQALAADVVQRYDQHLGEAQYNRALDALWELVRAGNKYVDTEAPWALHKAGQVERLQTVLRLTLEITHLAGALLLPVLTKKAPELLAKLGRDEASAKAFIQGLYAGTRQPLDGMEVGAALTTGEPLFPRIDGLPAVVADALIPAPPKEPKMSETPATTPAAAPATEAPAAPAYIGIEDFAKVELRVGKVLTCIKHPNADKLLVLEVDLGEPTPRTICSGLAGKFEPESLVGLNVVVVANLAPRKMRGIMSQGMILAAGGAEVIGLVSVDAAPGDTVR